MLATPLARRIDHRSPRETYRYSLALFSEAGLTVQLAWCCQYMFFQNRASRS